MRGVVQRIAQLFAQTPHQYRGIDNGGVGILGKRLSYLVERLSWKSKNAPVITVAEPLHFIHVEKQVGSLGSSSFTLPADLGCPHTNH